jgi:hypothetical protein
VRSDACRCDGLIRALTLSCALVAGCADTSFGADVSLAGLSPTERAVVARAFAPTLVFHPFEEFFPLNPMGQAVATTTRQEHDGGTEAAGEALPPVEGWRARLARYRTLPLGEKLRRASVGYRVFSRVRSARTELVVEYWCYYIYNAFTVRGGWLPYRVPDNHPHDLERLYVVLTPAEPLRRSDGMPDETWARTSFRIRSIIANAHDGSIPPNEYDADDHDAVPAPLEVLVERGSHAMAPDIDRDGQFTPGVDSTSIRKVQWGIRDRGTTWGRYRRSFMDGRGESAVRLCGPAAVRGPDADCPRYALHPADELQRWFGGLQLSRRELREIVGTTHWVMRTFGDVRVETLMVPTDPPDGRMLDRMLQRRTKTEAGFLMGFTTAAHAPAPVIGRRYFWDVPSRHVPDVAAEAVWLFPKGRRPAVEATLWSSYNVDAITNVLIGVGWFSRGRGADVITGTDLRIGRFRVRPSWRFGQHVYNTRVTTSF